jgi:D-3-phosphoglycerate dehydrogenase
MLILISDAFDASLPNRLKALGDVTDDQSRLPEADVVLVRSKTKCNREYIDRGKKLKLIIRGGVGMDNVDEAYAKEKGIAAHNTPEASTIAVAELAMALLLAAPNQLARSHQGMVEGKFLKNEIKRTELFGKTLGLLGVGRIATAVAVRARAFGMRVMGYDKYVTGSDEVQLRPVEQVLAEGDYFSLHMPLTAETKGFLDQRRLASMKKGVIIVNTGRGPCVDEAAMAHALESGHVACYATDVWSSDPPPADCPLLRAPNVLMTPHIGASSKENLLRIGDQVLELIKRHFA